MEVHFYSFTSSVIGVQITSGSGKLPDGISMLSDPKALQEKLLKSAVEGGIKMLLQLLDHLVNADQLLSSPQAGSFLVTPVPGAKATKPSTAEDLVASIQVSNVQICSCVGHI